MHVACDMRADASFLQASSEEEVAVDHLPACQQCVAHLVCHIVEMKASWAMGWAVGWLMREPVGGGCVFGDPIPPVP